MVYEMQGKVVLVTGGTGGLGQAVVEKFLASGATVIMSDICDDKGAALCEKLKGSGALEYVHMNVADSTNISNVIADLVKKYGHLDYAINNAAYTGMPSTTLHNFPEEETKKIFTVNLESIFLCMKHEITQMLKQENRGTIVNVASIDGMKAQIGITSYNAAKAGVISYTKTAAIEYVTDDIRINAVAPGMLQTDSLTALIETDPELAKMYLSGLPYGKPTQTQEVANAIVWLCSDEASGVSGAILTVDHAQILK